MYKESDDDDDEHELNERTEQREKKELCVCCLFYLDADGSATVVSIFIKLVLYFLISFIRKLSTLYLALTRAYLWPAPV